MCFLLLPKQISLGADGGIPLGHYWEDASFGKHKYATHRLEFDKQVIRFLKAGYQAPGGPSEQSLPRQRFCIANESRQSRTALHDTPVTSRTIPTSKSTFSGHEPKQTKRMQEVSSIPTRRKRWQTQLHPFLASMPAQFSKKAILVSIRKKTIRYHSQYCALLRPGI